MPPDDPRDPHDLVRTLRPQAFGKTRPTSIDDPVVEPSWPGIRILVAVGGATATLIDDGAPIDDHAALRAALTVTTASTTTGEGAILDGYLTKQVVTEGVGVHTWVNEYPTLGRQLSRLMVGGGRNRLEASAKRREAEAAAVAFDADDPVNLVVVDLLWLEGQWLLDVPLLERKRVLDSVLPAGDLVRPGPYVRPPIGTWTGSWRAQGFHGLTFKAANSRYRPGETAKDWATAPMPRR